MVRAILKGFYGNDSVLSNVMCDLGKTENDIYKSPNIIEDYETANKLFTAEYIFIREKVRENTVSELLSATRDDIQKQRRQTMEEFTNLSDAAKER